MGQDSTGPDTASVDDDGRRLREPLFGTAMSWLGLLGLVGLPLWIMLGAVVHMTRVNEQVAVLQERLRAMGQDANTQDVAWQVVFEPMGLLGSAAIAFVAVSVFVVLLGLGVAAWHGLTSLVRRSGDNRARARYTDEVEIGAEDWSRDLPEPEIPALAERARAGAADRAGSGDPTPPGVAGDRRPDGASDGPSPALDPTSGTGTPPDRR